MRGAEAAPHLDRLAPLVGCPLARFKATLDAESARVPPGLLEPCMDFIHRRLPTAFEWSEGQIAVGDARRAFDRRLGVRADPDRDRLLDRTRVDAGCLDRMKHALD